MKLFILLQTVLGLAMYVHCKGFFDKFDYFSLCVPPDPSTMPKLDRNEWWGPEGGSNTDESINPFKIQFTAEMIKDLKDRLSNTRPPPPTLKNVGFTYGFNSRQLSTWISYWKDQYPFAEREQFLNQFPQFTTIIQGLKMHFIWVKPQVPAGVKVYPLLIQHGWPGSVREFYKAIPLLTQQRPGYDFVFEVIAPSLPGFAFSEATERTGLGAYQIAVILRNLMHRVGHTQFYYQGGDWGGLIGNALATQFPDEVLGFHTNFPFVLNRCTTAMMVLGSVKPSLVVESSLADRMYPLSDFFRKIMLATGYFHQQATKPDTYGVGLTDSPAALMAYLLEKFGGGGRKSSVTREDGGLDLVFTKEELFDNLMIYWVSGAISTSTRIYAESTSQNHTDIGISEYQTTVPTWGLQAKDEIVYQPPVILKTRFVNLINVTIVEEGGHFMALEQPELLTGDVFKAVQAFINWRAANAKTEL